MRSTVGPGSAFDGDHDQAVRVFYGEWAEEQDVGDAEDGGVGDDALGQGEDGNGGGFWEV
jgi:hypothetical protein